MHNLLCMHCRASIRDFLREKWKRGICCDINWGAHPIGPTEFWETLDKTKLSSHTCRIPDKSNKMVGRKILHSIQVYTHVHWFPSRLTPVKGPPNLCNRFYVGTGFLLHKFWGALNRGQSRWKSMYMGINLNALQNFSAYHFIWFAWSSRTVPPS